MTEPNESRWISVSHKRPRQGEPVLIVIEFEEGDLDVDAGMYKRGKWYVCFFDMNAPDSQKVMEVNLNVIAWRPYPKYP